MNGSEVKQWIAESLPQAVTSTDTLGEGGVPLLVVEVSFLSKVCQFLKEDPRTQMNWLVNFFVMEQKGRLVLSYYLASRNHSHEIVVRSRMQSPALPSETVQVPSVQNIWNEVEPFEIESSELYGIQFGEYKITNRFGCAHLGGYPMREGFVWPTEVSGIPHKRDRGGTHVS